ncbi:MAG: glutamine-hydrolyzing GMP synthase, partial [Fidelibacterota bacterium]
MGSQGLTDSEMVLILDFGSQYTQLIARRVRECGIYSEIYPFHLSAHEIEQLSPRAIIFSGSPSSVGDANPPLPDPEVFSLGIPILGICYGLQIIAHNFHGQLDLGSAREYGNAPLNIIKEDEIFSGIESRTFQVWMSHGDRLDRLPENFESIGSSAGSPYAVIRNKELKIYAVQFHPEVVHTIHGKQMLSNFLLKIAGCKGGWSPMSFIKSSIKNIRERLGSEKVICALSGGVDSTVLSVLLHRAVGDNSIPVLIDNGLMRDGEIEYIEKIFRDKFQIHINVYDYASQFLSNLKG